MRPLNDYFLHTGPLDISYAGLLWRMVVPDDGRIVKLASITDIQVQGGQSVISVATSRGTLTKTHLGGGAPGATYVTHFDPMPVEPYNHLAEGDELQLWSDGTSTAGVLSFILIIRR